MRPDLRALLLLAALAAGCQSGPRYSTTEGKAVFAVDETLVPVLQAIAEDFSTSYPAATIEIRTLPARSAVVEFAADSVRRMVLGRELNSDERTALARGDFELAEHYVALDAAAVIGHSSNPMRELRMGQLDSMLTGAVTRWPAVAGGGVIALTLGDIDGSVNEIVRDRVTGGKPFASYAEYVGSSSGLVDRVAASPRALGVVALSWLRGREADVRVFALGTPGFRPDTTEPFGRFYTPVQAHVYRKYYPLTRKVMIYSREAIPEVGYGFISYVASAAGQKVFLGRGLVPATMPVRLVELTSREVNK